jgi:hypothetical protein
MGRYVFRCICGNEVTMGETEDAKLAIEAPTDYAKKIPCHRCRQTGKFRFRKYA